jgi:hypothetical protein
LLRLAQTTAEAIRLGNLAQARAANASTATPAKTDWPASESSGDAKFYGQRTKTEAMNTERAAGSDALNRVQVRPQPFLSRKQSELPGGKLSEEIHHTRAAGLEEQER